MLGTHPLSYTSRQIAAQQRFHNVTANFTVYHAEELDTATTNVQRLLALPNVKVSYIVRHAGCTLCYILHASVRREDGQLRSPAGSV
jgi:hypothetical protein